MENFILPKSKRFAKDLENPQRYKEFEQAIAIMIADRIFKINGYKSKHKIIKACYEGASDFLQLQKGVQND